MKGRRDKQAGEVVPTQTPSGAGGYAPQTTHQVGTLRDKIQTPQPHVPRGVTAQGSSRVEQKRDKASRDSNNGNITGGKRRLQHRRSMVRSISPERGHPGEGKLPYSCPGQRHPVIHTAGGQCGTICTPWLPEP